MTFCCASYLLLAVKSFSNQFDFFNDMFTCFLHIHLTLSSISNSETSGLKLKSFSFGSKKSLDGLVSESVLCLWCTAMAFPPWCKQDKQTCQFHRTSESVIQQSAEREHLHLNGMFCRSVFCVTFYKFFDFKKWFLSCRGCAHFVYETDRERWELTQGRKRNTFLRHVFMKTNGTSSAPHCKAVGGQCGT